jgi:hypothetical protein
VVEVSTFDTIHSDLMYIKRVKGKPLMATRSRIGIELKDGSVLSAYHHWDGYPQWLGRILTTHYNSREQAADLIDGGDMSSCWSDTVWGEDRTDSQKYGPEYYSARGENCPPRYDQTREEFLSNGEEFSYIFTSAGWVCYDMNEFNDNDPEIVGIPSGALAV